MTKSIPLLHGEIALIDDEDFDRINTHKWNFHPGGYAYRISKFLEGKRHSIWMHRFILDAPKGKDVDHINGNKLDNRRSNLRICTRSQNLANSRIRFSNESGYKGVDWAKANNKWRARIKPNGKEFHLGYFDNLEEAARAYDVAARKHFGEFAKLNFPEV